jgi:extracellular elastinolytic metalloproteinase
MKHISSYLWRGLSLVTLSFLLAAGPPAYAQQTEAAQRATQLALQTNAQWAGSDISAANFRISSARVEPSGLLYAYPQQLQGGIPVYNRVATLVFKNGKLSHHAGSFLPAKAFAGQPAKPTVTAAAAVATALASTPAHLTERPAATSAASGVEQQQTFAPAGVAHRPIEVRLVWATDQGTPRLAWNVNVELLATPDWLNIRVDATTGKVLGQDN